MTDNSELKRLAEHHLSLGQAYTVAKPSVLLALIAENERLGKERITEHQSLRSDRARNSLYMMIATSLIDDHPYERGGSDWDYEHPIHDKIISLLAERDQLRAEVAGLRTGYEAYEQVNAELKAEVGALREEVALDDKIIADRDRLLNMFDCPAHGQCIPYAMEQIEALRKDADRLDRLEIECEAYGTDIHEGNRWVVDGPFATVRDAIDAALGRGEQS